MANIQKATRAAGTSIASRIGEMQLTSMYLVQVAALYERTEYVLVQTQHEFTQVQHDFCISCLSKVTQYYSADPLNATRLLFATVACALNSVTAATQKLPGFEMLLTRAAAAEIAVRDYKLPL